MKFASFPRIAMFSVSDKKKSNYEQNGAACYCIWEQHTLYDRALARISCKLETVSYLLTSENS